MTNHDATEVHDDWLRSRAHDARSSGRHGRALALAAEFSPNLALVDIWLPGMDGYELAKQLRVLFGGAVRLVALTGYGQDSDRARSHAAGFDVHLVKPVDLSKLKSLFDHARSLTRMTAAVEE
jgi:CheY-like chemotaxis protein